MRAVDRIGKFCSNCAYFKTPDQCRRGRHDPIREPSKTYCGAHQDASQMILLDFVEVPSH